MVRTALLALALPALFACTGGSTDDASSAPAGPSTSRGSSGSEAAVPEAQQLTEAQLEDTLPSSSDMSAIFSPTEEDGSGKDDGSFLCGADVEHFDRRNAEARVGYGAQVGVSATRYSFAISQFDSPAVAVEQIQALGDAIDSCTTFASDGDTYMVAPMSAARRDDDTVAVQVTTKSAGFAVAVNVLVVRTGSSLVASLAATIGLAAGSTVDEVVRLTQETVERYEAEVGSA
jgi:hypothetical protein